MIAQPQQLRYPVNIGSLFRGGMTAATSLTDLIQRAQDGDGGALQSIFELTYEELRRMARNRLRLVDRDAVLDTTSLVHECFLRFANAKQLSANSRPTVDCHACTGLQLGCEPVDECTSSPPRRRHAPVRNGK